MKYANPQKCPSCDTDLAPGASPCPQCFFDFSTPEARALWSTLLHADELLVRAKAPQALTPSPTPAYEPAPRREPNPNPVSAGDILLILGGLFTLVAGSIVSFLTLGMFALPLMAMVFAGVAYYTHTRELKVSTETFIAIALLLAGMAASLFPIFSASVMFFLSLTVLSVFLALMGSPYKTQSVLGGLAALGLTLTLMEKIYGGYLMTAAAFAGLTMLMGLLTYLWRKLDDRLGAACTLPALAIAAVGYWIVAFMGFLKADDFAAYLSKGYFSPLLVVVILAAGGGFALKHTTGRAALWGFAFFNFILFPLMAFVDLNWPVGYVLAGALLVLTFTRSAGAWRYVRVALMPLYALWSLGTILSYSLPVLGSEHFYYNGEATAGMKFLPYDALLWPALLMAVALVAATHVFFMLVERLQPLARTTTIVMASATVAAATLFLPSLYLTFPLLLLAIFAPWRLLDERLELPSAFLLVGISLIMLDVPLVGMIIFGLTGVYLLAAQHFRPSASTPILQWVFGSFSIFIALATGAEHFLEGAKIELLVPLLVSAVIVLALRLFLGRAEDGVSLAWAIFGLWGMFASFDLDDLAFASLALTVIGFPWVVLRILEDKPLHKKAFFGLAVAFLGLGWVCRLHASNVTVFEYYTLPFAVLALAVGGYTMLKDKDSGSWPTLGTGLAMLTAPSLLMAMDDVVSWSALFLGLVATGLLLVGQAYKLQAPFVYGAVALGALAFLFLAPYAAMVSLWISLGLVGVVFAAIGATWEARVKEGRAAAAYVRAMR